MSPTIAMTRRQAVLTALAGAAFGAGGGLRPVSAQDIDLVSAAFELSRRINPWTLGWASAGAREFSTSELELVEGTPPAGLSGVLYRNGPALFDRAGWRVRHWFDGDGLVHAWRIGEGRASHRARFVETRKYAAEEAAGRFLAAGFGTVPPDPRGLSSPDDANAANTSVLPLGDTLYALWEAGSAWALDPETLESRGAHSWGEGLERMPFSAHPKVESDGRVWNIGTDYFSGVAVYRISPAGALEHSGILPLEFPSIIHDFAITQRRILIFAPHLARGDARVPVVARFEAATAGPITVHAYDKDGLAPAGRWELPPGFVFHYGNAWEEADGTVRVDFFHYPDGGFARHGAMDLMRGERPNSAPAVATQAILRPDGSAEMARLDDEPGEFPRTDPRRVGERHRYLWHVGGAIADIGGGGIVKRDWETGDVDRFEIGPDAIAEEHLFVPSGPAEDEGWLVGTALDLEAERMRLQVLDARRPSDGPVCVWAAPYALPLGFHGAWVGA